MNPVPMTDIFTGTLSDDRRRRSEKRRQQDVQRAFVVRLEGIRSKTISVMMEKKNLRMSQPRACRPLRFAML